MSVFDTKHTIKAALESFRSGNLSCNAINLFKALGYNTERQAPLEKQNYDSFKASFVDGNSRFNEEKAMVAEYKYVDLIFQISHEEITKQYSAFKKEVVTKEDGSKIAIESFLFFAIELKNETYSRSALSHITREVNKLFPMPAIVLFKRGLSLTLAVINRRLHKRDESKDVLEKVTFIKDINIETPHRAHIEILFDLSFEELRSTHKFSNFVELYDAWQKTLDTKELNKKFYKELSNWYFWAIEEVYFPGATLHADKNSIFKEKDKEKEHNANNLIRLLTRLLFVWFVKEKGLIPEEFFDEKYVANELLANFKPKKDRSGSISTISCYYRAILQNLFFATLNQNMGKREFRKPGQHMNVTNLLRYERYFKDSKKYIKLVEKTTPFMNGGLFECLDILNSEKRGRQGGDVIIYQDGFSDRDDNQLKVPDYIFFGTEDHVDLSEAYGDKGKEYKNAAVKGLINILKSYKFTVAENTPLEEEVALDPELLGRVFENLLASYNPETKTTARKQTGSFYTPREIVNYMVDESLSAYLEQKIEDAGVKDKEESLRDLISYSENPNPFNKKETTLLISAIDSSKILDPACGSGAFPMGILHKLVHILHKLDPRNELWEQKQVEKARTQDDPAIRDQLIADIEAAFENNELDYGRKLYLIENCIYGVDIQPIATQISKLRFFISLIVDQKVDIKKDNFGVRPLPNLETKFVSANTLIGIEKSEAQMSFGSAEVKALEEKLKDIRHRLFSAKTPTTKRKLREEDKLIREQMGNVLVKSGWKNKTARQLAGWDPYDQNSSSPFFDPEWMFGLTDGFDVVIGNPPYVKESTNRKAFDGTRNSLYYQGKMDLWYLFACHGFDLLKLSTGILTFIATNNWVTNAGASKFRNKISRDAQIISLIDFANHKIFESADIQTMVMLFKRNAFLNEYLFDYRRIIINEISANEITDFLDKVNNAKFQYLFPKFNRSYFNDKTFVFSNKEEGRILDLIYKRGNFFIDGDKELMSGIDVLQDSVNKQSSKTLGTNFKVGDGIFVLSNEERDKLNLSKKELEILKPYYTTKELQKIYANRNNNYWIIYTDSSFKNLTRIENYPTIKNHLDKFRSVITSENGPYGLNRPREEYFFKEAKIMSVRKCASPTFSYTDFDCYVSRAFFSIKTNRINQKYLTAVLNSKVIAFWLMKKGKLQGLQCQVDKDPIISIPIFNSKDTLSFEKTINYIFYIRNNSLTASCSPFFEHLIDAMVYELYFPSEIKSAKCEVLKHLTNLPDLKDDWNDEKKLALVEEAYNELSDPKHPVSVSMSKMQEIKEIKIIEGRE